MKRSLVIAAALVLATNVHAQSVQQSGSVTPNTSPVWSGTGIIKGGNTATDSPLTTFGVTRDAIDALCVSSDRVSAVGRNQLCFQAGTSGPAKISLQNYGTANAQALEFIINGTVYPFPGALASLIINSTPVTGGINGDCLTVAGGILSQTGCSILTAGTTGTGSIVLNNSPTLAGTIGGNLVFSGSETFTNNISFTSSLIVNGIATPASAVGNTVLLGTVSAPTLTNTGQAFLFNTSIGGATLQGDGSSFDISLVNKNGGVAAEVPTGTTTFQMPGAVIMSGLSSGSCTSGIGLNSSNQAITVSCPGAASSVQVGTTTIASGTTGNVLYNNGGTLGNETIASILTAGTGIAVTGTTNATIALGGTTTAHGVALWEGGGSNLGNTGAGTTGQALISQGGSADPTYIGGARVLLATLSASSSATLSDTTHVTSAYNEYILVFENILPATNNNFCEIQVHSNSSFQTTGYLTSIVYFGAGASSVANPTTYIPCGANNGTLANSSSGLSGEITLYNASQTSSPKMWTGNFAFFNTSSLINASVGGGIWNGGNTAIDGFQVLMNSGNIASGTVKLYGRL